MPEPVAPSPQPRRNRPAPPADRPDPGSPALRLVDAALVLGFLGLTFLLGAFPLKDTDFWWHLRAGDMIRQTGQVPKVDTLTFGAEGRPWVDLHWLFQVGISWGFARFGVPGLTLLKCAITTAAVALLVTARRREWPVWATVLAWIPAVLVLAGRMYIRPETMTLLYLSAYLAVLFRWERRPALAFLLPLVQVCWVNTQGLFPLGPVILVFALLDAAIRPGNLAPERRGWWRTVGPATVLVGVACLFNPYGLAGALYPLELLGTMGNPIFRTTIAELEPVASFIGRSGLTSVPLCLQLFEMLLGGLSFVVPILWRAWARGADRRIASAAEEPAEPTAPGRKRRSRARADAKAAAATRAPGRRRGKTPAEPVAWRNLPFRFLLFASFSALSLQATRNSHQFAAVVGVVMAWNFAEWAAEIRDRNARVHPERVAPGRRLGRRLGVLAAVAAVIALVGTGQYYVWAGEGRVIGLGEEKLWFPHDAVKFAGRPDMPKRLAGYHNGLPSLYEYYFGPGRKVYTDARLEVMGAELYSQYLALGGKISKNQPGWAEDLDALGRPALLVDTIDQHNAGMVATLLASRRWRCVWYDPIAALFVHDSSAGVIRDHEVNFLDRHYRRVADADPADPDALIANAKRAFQVAGMLRRTPGGDLAARGLVLLGLDYARRVRAVAPADIEGWKRAGLIEQLRQPIVSREEIPRFRMPFDPVFDLSLVRSTWALRRTLAQDPDDGITLMSLGQSFVARGMREPALPLFERFYAQPMRNETQQDYNRMSGEQAAVLRSQLNPRPATEWANLGDLDRVVAAFLAGGWAETAADVMEGAYKPEARSWAWTDRLAVLRLHLGQPDRARALWLEARDPASPAVRAARVGHTRLVEDDLEGARRSYAEAIAADPNLFEAYYALAILEQDAGRPDAARAAAERAEATAPNDHSRDAARDLARTIPGARPAAP